LNPEVIAKLEYVFPLGGNDKEACLYASVSPAALYEYQQIMIPDDELIQELTTLKYKVVNSNGTIRMEKKEEAKRRLG